MIGRTNSAGVMPVGTINITENGTYAISSFSQAIVSVSGLVPSGTLEISSNGTYDVTTYANASVNVQAGSYPYGDIETLLRGSTVYSGYLPSSIASDAFLNRRDLTSISGWFSSNWSMIDLGQGAFNGCWSLSYINFLEDKQIFIRSNTFAGCSALAVSIINPSYSYRSRYWDGCDTPFGNTQNIPLISMTNSSGITLPIRFFGNAGVSKIYISAPVIYMSNYVFNDCRCSDITFSANYLYMYSNMGGLFQQCIIEHISMSIRESINWNIYYNIGGYFACSCPNLKTVTLDLTTFSGSSFNGASVGYAAFQSCVNLERCTFTTGGIPLLVNSVSQYAFHNTPKLDIKVAENCNTYSYAFWGCGLYSFVNAVQQIMGSSHIGSCPRLRYVRLSNMYYFYPYNFMSCPKLSYVNIHPSISISAQQNVYFGSFCFAFCTSLKSVLFSQWATFYSHAFRGCTSLESLYLLSTSFAENTYNNAFYQTPLLDSSYLGHFGSIYVPSSMVESYKTRTNWTQFSDRFVGLTDEEIATIVTAYDNVPYTEPEE